MVKTHTAIKYIFSAILIVFCVNRGFTQGGSMKFEHITSDDGLPQNTIHGIARDKYGFMWFGTWGGVCRYDGYSFKVYTYDPDDDRSINNNRIHNIIRDKKQNIWIRTANDSVLCMYNYAGDNFKRVNKSLLPDAFVKLMNRRTHIETVKFSYGQYTWHIDDKTNTLAESDNKSSHTKTYYNHSEDPGSLNDSYVTDIYKDDHNTLWVGTFSNGINKANLNAKPFRHFYRNPSIEQSLIHNNIRSICQDRAGNMWMGTRDQGITIMGKGIYRHVKKGNSGINDNQVRSLFCDSRGIVWIGTKAGLNAYNPVKDKFRDFAKEGLKETAVFGITEDQHHDLLFATWNGVYKYSVQADRLILLDSAVQKNQYFGKVVLQDKKGQIWVGTEGARGITVYKYGPGRKTLIQLMQFVHNENINSIGDNFTYCIYEDRDGIIWMGNSAGLDRYDPVKGKFLNLSLANLFPKSPVSAIVEDRSGFLWISHKKGISQLNRNNFSVGNFTRQDGLQSNEFSDGAAYRSRIDQRLYFGGNKGFNVFFPDSILRDETLPNTVLTELQILNHRIDINEEVNGRVVLTKPLYLTSALELMYGDKSVAIEFAGLHYSNPEKNKYAYMLAGFDKDWVFTDASRRIATYSNLKPGKYIFKVISSNSDGVWNRKPAMLKIRVLPPFWASVWAYAFYFLLVLSIICVYHFYSTRFTRMQSELAYDALVKEKENELLQRKLQFFTNLSHEIKTPLTLILAPMEKLGAYFAGDDFVSSQLATMKGSAARLMKLVTQILDFRKLDSGNIKLNLQMHDIVAFLKQNVLAFAPLAASKNIDLVFEPEAESYIFCFDEDKLEKVIANLLSNALKFTPDEGWIELRLEEAEPGQNGFLKIEVINRGPGIDKNDLERIFKPFQQGAGHERGGAGLGLAFSKTLVELHHGTLSVTSTPVDTAAFITCFRIELPVVRQDSALETALPSCNRPFDFAGMTSENGARNGPVTGTDASRVLINGKCPAILIVEDNTELRVYLKNHFENYYHVLEAQNGREGLDKAAAEIPDLIISDVMMAGMDGFEFCKQVKAKPGTGQIPVILLTAKGLLEDQITGIESGADDYITKPFNWEYLAARVKNLLVSRDNLKERYRKEISIRPTDDSTQSPDDKFLRKLLEFIESRIADPALTVEDICSEIGVSRAKLYRKVKDLTGLTIAEVIKEIRFNRAKQLLREQNFKISEIAFMVGFSEANYFGKCFKAEFGMSPSEYTQNAAPVYKE